MDAIAPNAAPADTAEKGRAELLSSSARQKLLAFAGLVALLAFFSFASPNFLQ